MLYVSQKEIIRSDAVKYLRAIVDDKLSWSKHLKELALKLSRYCSLFHYVCGLVTKTTLNIIYYSFVYNRIQCGVTMWDKNNYMKSRYAETIIFEQLRGTKYFRTLPFCTKI